MQFRKFGNLNWKSSALGFGCMRLPIDSEGKIIENEAIKIIRYGIDQGINYIDTAYPYHKGTSEIIVGKALKDNYRKKVMLATKCPVWLLKKADDFDTLLDEQLKKLSTDHIDFYLLHALDSKSWKIIQDLNILNKAEEAIKKGKIKYLGFSFHDKFEVFKEIIDGYNWTFCQIQYNYMDINNQAGTKGLRYAYSKGIAVIVMEPIRGGLLANPPKRIAEIFDESKNKHTPADWALQWVWNQPEVSLVLSGMSTLSQVEENIHSVDVYGVDTLSKEDLKIIERVREEYSKRETIPCTKCNYCMPCPNGVNIPKNFELYNEAVIYDDTRMAGFRYSAFLSEAQRANKCIQCKICETKCPQKIKISQWMPKVHEKLKMH